MSARAALLRRIAELFLERMDDLAAAVTQAMGKLTREARGEIKLVASTYRYSADNAEALLADVPLTLRMGGAAVVHRSRSGRCWAACRGYPYYQVA